MKCELVGISKTFDNSKKTHYSICFVLSKDELNSYLERAKELSRSVGTTDPSGRPRTENEKLCRALAGVVSEEICSTTIKEYARLMKRNLFIHTKPFLSALDQIDLTVSVPQGSFDIEIRSSGHFKQNLVEIYNENFSIIGWYVTYAKAEENRKDFYVTVLFPFSIDRMLEQVEIRACISGGATKEMLEKIGTNRHLKQEGATYRTIFPVAKAFDGPEIISKIISAPCDMNIWRGLQNANF